MKKVSCKFKLKQRVYILGQSGLCVVTGRGVCDFASGGKMPMYQIQGGHSAWVQESELLSEIDAGLLRDEI